MPFMDESLGMMMRLQQKIATDKKYSPLVSGGIKP
jgi:hypothetical protein